MNDQYEWFLDSPKGAVHILYFENYKTIFLGTDNNKFNKNIILLSIREMTNLSTKEIRNAMKRFKKLYYVVLNGMIE